jgi:hypothetical protein
LTWTATDFETKTQIAIEATLADEAVLKIPLNCVKQFLIFTIENFKTETCIIIFKGKIYNSIAQN